MREIFLFLILFFSFSSLYAEKDFSIYRGYGSTLDEEFNEDELIPKRLDEEFKEDKWIPKILDNTIIEQGDSISRGVDSSSFILTSGTYHISIFVDVNYYASSGYSQIRLFNLTLSDTAILSKKTKSSASPNLYQLNIINSVYTSTDTASYRVEQKYEKNYHQAEWKKVEKEVTDEEVSDVFVEIRKIK